MNSKISKYIISVYSICFGVLGLILLFIEKQTNREMYVFAFEIIALAIILLILKSKRHLKGFMIALLVIYSIFTISGVIALFFEWKVGLITLALVVVPLVFTIIYLLLDKKECMANVNCKRKVNKSKF